MTLSWLAVLKLKWHSQIIDQKRHKVNALAESLSLSTVVIKSHLILCRLPRVRDISDHLCHLWTIDRMLFLPPTDPKKQPARSDYRLKKANSKIQLLTNTTLRSPVFQSTEWLTNILLWVLKCWTPSPIGPLRNPRTYSCITNRETDQRSQIQPQLSKKWYWLGQIIFPGIWSKQPINLLIMQEAKSDLWLRIIDSNIYITLSQ